jgi:hypothetical protein
MVHPNMGASQSSMYHFDCPFTKKVMMLLILPKYKLQIQNSSDSGGFLFYMEMRIIVTNIHQISIFGFQCVGKIIKR